jgi:hypothetical protein
MTTNPSTATVWRVDLDTDENTWMTRKQLRATSAEDAESMYASLLNDPPTDYATITLVFDCRVQRQQMLHGDQEYMS